MSFLCFTFINHLHMPPTKPKLHHVGHKATHDLALTTVPTPSKHHILNCECCFPFPCLSILSLLQLKMYFFKYPEAPSLLLRSSYCIRFLEKPCLGTQRDHRSFPKHTFMHSSHCVCSCADYKSVFPAKE